MAETEKVDNQYRIALADATPGARVQSTYAGLAFSTVTGAIANGAWKSTTADAFYAECAEMRTTAGTAGTRCVEEMTSRHAREPVKVDPTDSRAKWH